MAPATRAPTRRVPLNAGLFRLVLPLAVLWASPVAAQDPFANKESPLHSIEWTDGERQVDIGNVAEFTIPSGCRFTDAKGAQDFLQMTQNVPSGREQGLLLCPANVGEAHPWFVVFSFDPSGYVRDDDRKKLDAGKILATIREGTARANQLRKEQGWDELTIDGWVRAPYYDTSTHNLTWSIRGHSTDGASVNHSVRLLGRRGVLHADLVASPEQLDGIVSTFDSTIATTAFLRGHRYAEWRKGDKVAAYGLTALVAGGAGVAVATKLGLFGKLWKVFAIFLAKLGKLAIALVIGVAALIKSLFRRRREATA